MICVYASGEKSLCVLVQFNRDPDQQCARIGPCTILLSL